MAFGLMTLMVLSGAVAGFCEETTYKMLATKKTSTMEKEMNEAADAGFRFDAVGGGETGWAGSEALVIMSRRSGDAHQYEYKLLATQRTSTMQKEMSEAADAGFILKGQTVFKSTFGGKEVVTIMERDRNASGAVYEYKLLATSRTSTMEKELSEAADAGFEIVGMSQGGETVVILKRAQQ